MSDETQAATVEITIEDVFRMVAQALRDRVTENLTENLTKGVLRVVEQALRDRVTETAIAAGVSASRVEAIGRGEVPTSNELDDLAFGFVDLIVELAADVSPDSLAAVGGSE
jgi:hypothetical protein